MLRSERICFLAMAIRESSTRMAGMALQLLLGLLWSNVGIVPPLVMAAY
jgi:hypothetical protein